MKTEKNILIAFILNLSFSVFEFTGGIFTGSVAIISDAIHDMGDALSIGFSYFFEKISKKQPDEKYSYGYTRFSVLGSLITNLILLVGSTTVIFNAIHRIINPCDIHYSGMIIFAIAGVFINLSAAIVTREGKSLNQKAVNLHMLEDVLGWLVVLIGAIIMKFTDFTLIDPIMSICVTIFILINVAKNLKEIIDIFLEKTPKGVSIGKIKELLEEIEGVLDVHHIHIRCIDGQKNYATMHIVTNEEPYIIKKKVRGKLKELSICHATLEFEKQSEHCHELDCHIEYDCTSCDHHHKHHHHH